MRSVDSRKNRCKILILLFIYLFVIQPSNSYAQHKQKKDILIINSYHHGLEWSDNIVKGIREVFETSRYDIHLYIEYMDTRNNVDQSYLNKLYDLYKYKFKNKKFDLIITSDDPAYNFLLKYQNQIFNNTPAVFCGVNEFQESQLNNHPFVTGIVETVDIKNTVSTALNIHPYVKKIVVINENTKTGNFYKAELQKVLPQLKQSVQVQYFEDFTMAEVQDKVRNLNRDSIVLLLPFYKDRAGKSFSALESISLISQSSKVPIYTLWDVYIRHGALGGKIVDSFTQGKFAAQMALRILNGESISNIKVIKNSSVNYMFDYRQMKNFRIQTALLPKGSIIVNSPSSFYAISKAAVWYGLLLLIIFLVGIIFILIKNIFSRKEVEERLRESRARYKKLVSLSPNGIFLVEEGRICFVNAAGVKLLGAVSTESLLEEKISDFLHSDSITILEDHISSQEYKFIKKDGKSIDVEVVTTDFSNEEKQERLIVVQDITEKKLLHEAKEYDKLKDEFFANLSHELRTPLNLINSALQLLELSIRDYTNNDKNHPNKYIITMKQNSYRLLRLVNNLIDITKIDSGFFEFQLKNHNIVNIVEEITLSVSEYVKSHSLQLIFDTEIEEKITACDPNKIERMMLNLLSNAIKFTKPGGSIFVNIYDKKDTIQISVKDTGMGISADKQKIIFERFRQVDKSFTRSHEGSGIGLSLIKSLVELHGGVISVQSEYGKGSEFIIELPVYTIEESPVSLKIDKMEDYIERINIEFSDIYSWKNI